MGGNVGKPVRQGHGDRGVESLDTVMKYLGWGTNNWVIAVKTSEERRRWFAIMGVIRGRKRLEAKVEMEEEWLTIGWENWSMV